ncbi:hypothetical protein ACJIZ3_013106 [Penstemon smallii]|uniref:Uncharacterized protein n=1 Tax=Penstemon smallii TaxID=265156 RepID=A0ABD3UNX4_9LAMI
MRCVFIEKKYQRVIGSCRVEDSEVGYCCDVRREAAFNLHLIYKESGAFDLARQMLKDYCSL